ncbi:hypothetical protein SAMN04490220_0057 [Rhodococcus jostii]|uniref:Uncharacterized protein n=1 Tax=Rhodococcus jostii TaxID=132919 RepID=A0A1H4IJ82_RHOJO|nr:hypothetical protein SAMN04490220_0057 [Rhodococcus jostii]
MSPRNRRTAVAADFLRSPAPKDLPELVHPDAEMRDLLARYLEARSRGLGPGVSTPREPELTRATRAGQATPPAGAKDCADPPLPRARSGPIGTYGDLWLFMEQIP